MLCLQEKGIVLNDEMPLNNSNICGEERDDSSWKILKKQIFGLVLVDNKETLKKTQFHSKLIHINAIPNYWLVIVQDGKIAKNNFPGFIVISKEEKDSKSYIIGNCLALINVTY